MRAPEIDADRQGAGSLQRARFSGEALSIKLWKTRRKSFVQEAEAGSLAATDVLSDLLQVLASKSWLPSLGFLVLAMKRDEIAEELDVAGFCPSRFPAIDPPLAIDGLRILSAEKCLVDIFPLSSDLDFPKNLISAW